MAYGSGPCQEMPVPGDHELTRVWLAEQQHLGRLVQHWHSR